ncbi:MAG: right-handed parallel beta-helix repeat-containing protein [Candidatus Polarisedimenticolia bacterium]
MRSSLRLLIVTALAGMAMPAQAAIFTVNRTNQAGAGTLRAAITAANGVPGSTIQFAIPTTDGGYSAATGVFTISLNPALPAITATGTIIDGTTQAAAIGNTNPGVMGTGGTVGVDALALPTVNRPEILIVDGGSVAIGLDIQAANVTIRGLAIYGFGTAPGSDTSGNIRVGAGGSGALIEQNVLGSTAVSFTDPGAATRTGGDNIRVVSADNGIVRNNLIGFAAGKGIGLNTGANGWRVEGNEIRRNGIGNAGLGAVDVENTSGGAVVRGNLLTQSEGGGFDSSLSTGGGLVENNTISGNALGAGALLETAGVRLFGTGTIVDRNVISGNTGAGIMVTSGATGNLITRNAISGNGPGTGQIGIDLLRAADNQLLGTAPFVTQNDAGDADAGGNALLNFPVLTAALAGGGDLSLAGYARPGSVIELFVAAPDPSGFGEGLTYLVTLTEGSGADTDAATGTYTNPVNGLNQGTDTTNRFRFTIPAPPGVAVGTVLTATATLAGSTSEFSGNVTVRPSAEVTLLKSAVPGGPQPPGTELTYAVLMANAGSTTASSLVLQDSIPASTDFKIGSVTTNLGTSGLTASVSYSSDGGATWTYTPASGAGGAPAGFDGVATHIRWTFTGTLGFTVPNNQATMGFTTRIR